MSGYQNPGRRIPGSRSTALLLALGCLLLPATAPERASAQASPLAAGQSAGPVDRSVIADLVVANHILTQQGVLDAYGHVSVRHPGSPQRFLMSRSLAPALVGADDIMEYDLDGNPVDPRGRASFLERFIHAEIYRARPDVQAVIHSHTATVIPFGVTQVPLRPIIHVAAFLPRPVPVFEIRKFVAGSDLLIGTPDLGKALATTLGSHSVVLMRGHGMAVAAATLPLAVYYAIYTGIDAHLESQAIALGGPITFLDDGEAEAANKLLAQVHLRAWNLWKQEAVARDATNQPAK
jgi:HCOMODA/2-hydroxy-3-carboxy-muconic semialdehyde decarboxylase